MAEENLGTAVLKIIVNDDEARSALNLLKRDVQATTQQATRARRTTGRAGVDPEEAARKKAERAADQAANKRVSIQNRLNILEAKGVDVTAFRLRAARANEAAQQSQFDTARRINAELGRALSIEENRLRVSAAQAAQLKRQEAATKSVTSTERTKAQKPTGVGFATTPEQVLASRGGTQKGAAEGITALADAAGKAIKLRNRINILEAKGVDVSKLQVQYQNLLTAGRANELGLLQRRAQELKRILDIEENTLRVNKLKEQTRKRGERPGLSAASQQAREASLERRAELRSLQTAGGGGGGLTTFLRDIRVREEGEKRIAAERAKGYKQASFAENTLQTFTQKRSALTLREARERTRLLDKQKSALSGALSSAVIGGAFPLLFGQGGGAAAGGLVGGLFGGVAGQGGGFAGSLAGTLIGQQLDIFNQLAKALQDPVANFKQLVEASNLSSKGLESYIQVLIDSGRTAEAEAAIRKDISRTIDPVTLAQASAANDQYARTIADVQERLGTILAGPATQFVGWLEEVIKRLAFLPSPDRGPISDAGRERLSLANRGAGTAVGLAGIGIAGVSAATGFFPGVLAGGAIAATGGAQFALGESQQEQVVLAKLLKGVQQEILAVEEKRIAVQRQIVAASEQGGSGQKELAFQASLLDVEAKRKKAKADFLARDLSTESFKAYKLEVEALKLTEKQLKANEALRVRTLAAQKQLDNSLTTAKLQGIAEEIEATKALGQAEQGVARDTLATAQAIRQSVNEARRREQGIADQITAARQAGKTEEIPALLNLQTTAAEQTKLAIQQGALSLQQAGEKLLNDAKSARDSLRSAQEGAFDLLRRSDQISLVERARADIQSSGVLDPTKVFRLGERDLLSAASSARSIVEARTNLVAVEAATSSLAGVNEKLNSNVTTLTKAVEALTAKEWDIYINNNYTGSAAKELLAAATLP